MVYYKMIALFSFFSNWYRISNTIPEISMSSLVPDECNTLRLVLLSELGGLSYIGEVTKPLDDLETWYNMYKHYDQENNLFGVDNITTIELIPTDEFG